MKKLLLWVLISVIFSSLIITFMFTGCKEEAAPVAEEVKEEGAAPAEEEAAEVTVEEEVTLRLSSWVWEEPGYKDFMIKSTEAFMDNYPNIKIEPFYYPWAQLCDKVIVETMSGNPPDSIMTYHGNQHEFSKMGMLTPLDERIAEANLNEILQDFQQTFPVYNGKTYAVALAARTEQLAVNKEIFEKQNVEIPTNYDEFIEAAYKLTSEPDGIYGLSSTTNDSSRLYEAVLLYVVAYSGNFAKDGKPTVNDPQTLKGVQLYKDFFDDGVIPPGTDHSTAQKYFVEEKAAMFISGPWVWALIEEQNPNLLDKIAFLDNPFPNNVALGGPNNLLAIAEGSEHKDEAWEYIKFISNEEWGKEWVNLTKSSSAVRGAITEEFLAENPWFQAYVNGLSKAVQVQPEGLETQNELFTTTVRSHLMEILYNDKSVEEEMNKCQEELESVLIIE